LLLLQKKHSKTIALADDQERLWNITERKCLWWQKCSEDTTHTISLAAFIDVFLILLKSSVNNIFAMRMKQAPFEQ